MDYDALDILMDWLVGAGHHVVKPSEQVERAYDSLMSMSLPDDFWCRDERGATKGYVMGKTAMFRTGGDCWIARRDSGAFCAAVIHDGFMHDGDCRLRVCPSFLGVLGPWVEAIREHHVVSVELAAKMLINALEEFGFLPDAIESRISNMLALEFVIEAAGFYSASGRGNEKARCISKMRFATTIKAWE